MEYNSDAARLQTLSREQLKRAAKILKLKGYSNKNKSEIISMISENKNKVSDAVYDANETVLRIREVLGLSTSGNVKNPTQGLRKSKKEDAKPAKQQAEEALKAVKEALKASSEMPKLRKQLMRRLLKAYESQDDQFKRTGKTKFKKVPSKQSQLKTREERNKSAKESADLISDV